MNETKHTPGPWIVNTYETNSRTNPRQVTVIAPGMTIRVSGFRQDANANLIAAAPELLAVTEKLDALQRQFEYYSMGNKMPGNDLYSGLLMEIVTEARAAIAAAKGEA